MTATSVSITVATLQEDVYKRQRVGSTNTGQYLLMAFCMIYLLMELLEKRREAGELIARLPH